MHLAIYFCAMDLAGLEVQTRGQGGQGYFCRVAEIPSEYGHNVH